MIESEDSLLQDLSLDPMRHAEVRERVKTTLRPLGWKPPVRGGNRTGPTAPQLALAAAGTNEFGQGVVALQEAKNVPGLTAEQLQTVEQAAQALTRELVRRAESGDARAKADLELIERFRSQ
jgi:hypothetical protein